ncbi:MAG: ferredoxin-type protein NapF [Rhodocyclaceae bacterium]|nr:ferredoxin-type protein NapF [Rhodocyclaceae bacterium]MBK6907669.1 ferredoxin-type protein NapF [Rhodocyclaceae bacterium]
MSEINHSRRGFLRGKISTTPAPLRPPWSGPERDFLSRCTRCGECAKTCPTKIIVVANGYPQIDFSAGQCTFCHQCSDVCRDGALVHQATLSPWQARARIADTCMAHAGVECRICGEHCAESAIRFSPRLGGPPLPEVNNETCTGCGACLAVCPASAINVR